jgi:hypothetical protein
VTKAHRDRGVATERLLAKFLREHGFPNAERAVKTGVVTRGRTVVDPGDITGTPGLVWQAKGLRPITAAENAVPGWMLETEQQRAGAGAGLGVLVVRRDQRPAEQWFAFLPVADLYRSAGLQPTLDDSPPWGWQRDTIIAWPARLYLADLVTLLRSWGYGDRLVEPVLPATGAPDVMRALP